MGGVYPNIVLPFHSKAKGPSAFSTCLKLSTKFLANLHRQARQGHVLWRHIELGAPRVVMAYHQPRLVVHLPCVRHRATKVRKPGQEREAAFLR